MERAVAEIKARKPKMVGIQLPDGLRDFATEIAAELERETGVPVMVSGDAHYGACDLALGLERLGVDLLVDFGHVEMPSLPEFSLPVLFLPVYSRAPVAPVVEKAIREIVGTRVGVVSMAQHMHKLDEALEVLRKGGKDPRVGRGDTRLAGPAQILGCNYTSATVLEPDVDSFLYIGTGDFHPLGLAFVTEKRILVADPQTGDVRRVDLQRDRILRQRHAAIERARDAKRFGVILSTKVGQQRLFLAQGLVKLIRREGREAFIIALDHVSPDALLYFRHLDAFVNTACPRISTDDHGKYPLPILTPPELEIVLGRRTWEDYRFDTFHGGAETPR
ncbi:MAG: diphthamide biosynthesis enzyme Dph2 [Methanobacteriota archaeon]